MSPTERLTAAAACCLRLASRALAMMADTPLTALGCIGEKANAGAQLLQNTCARQAKAVEQASPASTSKKKRQRH